MKSGKERDLQEGAIVDVTFGTGAAVTGKIVEPGVYAADPVRPQRFFAE